LDDLILPPSLLNLSIAAGVHINGVLDLSNLKITATQVELQKDLILPTSLTRLEMGPAIRIKGKVDTSRCKILRNNRLLGCLMGGHIVQRSKKHKRLEA
jgi:hypothetical protein